MKKQRTKLGSATQAASLATSLLARDSENSSIEPGPSPVLQSISSELTFECRSSEEIPVQTLAKAEAPCTVNVSGLPN